MPVLVNSSENPDFLHIGLVNNMPDSALEGTERQFLALLTAAAGEMMVRLTHYTLPDVPRTDAGLRHVGSYHSIEELWDSHLDGLIVTGTEPKAANLMDEPYWPSLAKLVDWADENTSSTVWSCLAAHAAVLHLDGIRRCLLDEKRLGVFNCLRIADHPLTADAAARLHMPHSRWNDLPEALLKSSGYQFLTRSEAGIDLFIKRRNSLFVFFQGHPEYETDTLLLEYRRDIRRFLHHESQVYPAMPGGYFNDSALALLNTFRESALEERHERLLAEFPTALISGTLDNSWNSDAMRVYRNWLVSLAEIKAAIRSCVPVGMSRRK